MSTDGHRDITLRIVPLAAEGRADPDIATMSPAERIDVLWQLIRYTWETRHGDAELRLRRDVGRLVRGAG